ncbi:uncharacterized protein H6S33_006343 [Morchella sextelata]|uniref:uncharacterized protein n=1 Tax=Morchella sextelata TaxID=1174677 RepID=UPI001D051264|nr:uncharacterized protein H6S33_006343 [Morchella sextelata]KAH0604675.1 hypothetical protein H6S33_006343 [Morchella sextelata]
MLAMFEMRHQVPAESPRSGFDIGTLTSSDLILFSEKKKEKRQCGVLLARTHVHTWKPLSCPERKVFFWTTRFKLLASPCQEATGWLCLSLTGCHLSFFQDAARNDKARIVNYMALKNWW